MPVTASPSRKLASMVAERIASDVARDGLQEGDVVGSEAELLVRYDVSRAVFREAVRLLEHQEVGRMRRGPGGGLVVTTPTLESAFDAAMVYLIHTHVSLDEVLDVRLALEAAAASLAAERRDEDGIMRLRDLVRREASGDLASPRDLHGLVAGLSSNPALEFFVDLLTRMASVFTPEVLSSDRVDVVEATCGAHAKIVESIVAGNEGQAAGRMRRHLKAEADYLSTHLPSEPRLGAVFGASAGDHKLAEHVARELFADIGATGRQVGAPLGSEPELMERFGVSRAIMREAARLLEHHGIAAMRRGPGGGLFVSEPGIDATSAAIAFCLDRRQVNAAHLFEVRSIVEMTVLDRVVKHFDASMARRLHEVHDIEQGAAVSNFPVVGHDLHVVLGELSGNAVLELFTDVLVRLSRGRGAVPSDSEAKPLPTREVIDTHQKIIDAIVARDVDLARFRMRRHLDALQFWVR
jgi:DNA-binding FadR family transcriptional regulator